MKIGVCFLLVALFVISFIGASSVEINIDLDFDESAVNSMGSEGAHLYVSDEEVESLQENVSYGGIGSSNIGSENKFVEALGNSNALLFGVVLIAVILLVGLGVGVYFLVRRKTG